MLPPVIYGSPAATDVIHREFLCNDCNLKTLPPNHPPLKQRPQIILSGKQRALSSPSFTWKCWNIGNTVDGRNPANHLGCIKPCKEWDKPPINWCRISSINSISAHEPPQKKHLGNLVKHSAQTSLGSTCRRLLNDHRKITHPTDSNTNL